jgi:Fungal Zn(2)-Cys(6) binuclear cluster domain
VIFSYSLLSAICCLLASLENSAIVTIERSLTMSEQAPRRGSTGSGRRRSSTSQTNEGTINPVEQTQISESTRQSSSLFSQAPPSTPIFRLPTSPVDRGPPKAPKVAIPRLLNRGDSAAAAGSKVGGRHRVMHACEPCRTRKTKCSGEKPACRHCQDFRVSCIYADGKRDRAKK